MYITNTETSYWPNHWSLKKLNDLRNASQYHGNIMGKLKPQIYKM